MKSLAVFDFAVVTQNVPTMYKAGKINKGVQKSPRTMPSKNISALSGGISCRNLIDLGWVLTK